MFRWTTWICLICLVSVWLPSAGAQTASTGALTGTVTDTSGGVIPNVTVTLTADTGQERVVTTDAAGTYRFALLPPGDYKVRFAASGFKEVEVPAVKVNITEIPVLNRSLELGTQTQAVTVEANAEALQTASSTLGTTVESRTVTALPLSTRNYLQILTLAAGTNATVNNATALGRGNQEVAVNGANVGQNAYSIDGAQMKAMSAQSGNNSITESNGNASMALPNPDSLLEFKIQTSLYDAGFGRNPGANVSVITKSGTNEFHGTAFGFLRNTDFNANDFFQNLSGGKRLVLNANQWGGVVGGPIKKDKLFFFTSFQDSHQKNGLSKGTPSAAFSAQGTTSQGFASGSTLFPIPTGPRGTTSASGAEDAAGQAFQSAVGAAVCPANHPGGNAAFYQSYAGGTQVACDGSNINPIAMRLLQATIPGGLFLFPSSSTGQYQTNATFSIPALDNEHQIMGNGDYLLNAKNTLSGRWYYLEGAGADLSEWQLSNSSGSNSLEVCHLTAASDDHRVEQLCERGARLLSAQYRPGNESWGRSTFERRNYTSECGQPATAAA